MSTTLNTSIELQFRRIEGLKIRFGESEQRDERCDARRRNSPAALAAGDRFWDRFEAAESCSGLSEGGVHEADEVLH